MTMHVVIPMIAASGLLGARAGAQVITVDITDDLIDVNPETATVADLPGPDGHISFSEAMIASNNTPGRQTIGFAIPTSDWTYLSWYFPGRAVVHTVVGFYWRAYDEVTIDGRTQAAFTGNTNPDGWEVVLWGTPIYLNADNCSVFGLDNSAVSVTESNGLVEDNTAMSIELFGGSGSVVKGNTCGTIKIDRSNNNVVIGNTTTRVRVLGWVGGGQPAANNRIGGPAPEDRNYITGYGTWSSEGYPGGTTLQIFDSVGTIVENNWIGTTPDGLAQGSLASTQGIGFEGENHGALIRNNRIAGILGHGTGPHYAGWLVGSAVDIYGIGSDITLVGNTIGLNANGQATLGSVTGVATRNYYLGPVQNVVIGGSGAGQGNEIAGHLQSGVSVANTYSGVRIAGNSIHDNGGLGIDLITDGFQTGVTPNDPGDGDTGGNGLQNHPVLQSASAGAGGTSVSGSLNSLPDQSFVLEIFASPGCDPSGHGEGLKFLGSVQVTTDGSGNAPVSAILPSPAPAGSVVTATATHVATGNTSEFSACVAVQGGACYPDCNTDGTLTVADFGCFQTKFVAGDPYADCNGDGLPTVADFGCFQTRFVQGCP